MSAPISNILYEAGITEHSLHNARIILHECGLAFRINMIQTDHGQEHYVIADFARGHTHVFTGFSWGYAGTGPHGLLTFLHNIGCTFLDIQNIAAISDEPALEAFQAKVNEHIKHNILRHSFLLKGE